MAKVAAGMPYRAWDFIIFTTFTAFSPVNDENISENFLDSHRKFLRRHFRTAHQKKMVKMEKLAKIHAWQEKQAPTFAPPFFTFTPFLSFGFGSDSAINLTIITIDRFVYTSRKLPNLQESTNVQC
ncbi:MAG: hypothetical protein DU481_10280 [Nitrosomonas sp.]|uniref:hypothetical protein n=1 Tax=Nitrosomonas sp. TaxID=42353 RepID=UPI0032EEA06D